MSVRIVAPLVVYPDIISKKASVKEVIDPWIIKGRAERAETRIHPKKAMKKPSFMFTSVSFLKNHHKGSPNAIIMMAEIRIENRSLSL